ncbi:MAG: hypothetical protein ACE14L_00325 [Terriglobales bacterium]
MRAAVLQSVAVVIAVAAASRFSEWLFGRVLPHSQVQNLVGMSVAGATAGVLFFLWRYQLRQRLRLLHERERVVRHVHHHIRNSLQVIVNRHPDDPLVRRHVEHILKEMNYALPGRGRHMPEGPERLGRSE